MRASQIYNDHLFHKQPPQLDLQRCPSPKWFQPVLNQVSIGLNWSQFLPTHVAPKPERTKGFVRFLDHRQSLCCE